MKSQKQINWLLSIKYKFILKRQKIAYIFLVLNIFLYNSINAQKQNAIWCFGDSAGINFSDTSNLTTFSTALDTRGSCVSIADTNGQLLFYANTRATLPGYTTRVWNRLNQIMDGGDSIVGRAWFNELIIIPRPGFASQYYLFTAGVTIYYGLYYSIIDMSENGGLGKVIQKNIPIHSFEAWDGMAAIKHANGRDWWLITKDNRSGSPNGSNVFTKYLITDTAIIEILQSSGSVVYGGAGTMTFSKTGTKFLFTTWAGLIEVFDFDRCLGLFSNPIIVTGVRSTGNIVTVGSAFSPDENVVYVSQNDTTSYLFQYSLSAANINASKDTLSVIPHPHVAGGVLRLAPDDKIYWSCVWNNEVTYNFPYADSMFHTENMNLSVISSPNSLGSTCNFSLYGFYLGGKRTYWGLPNNPDYSMGPLSGSICDTLASISSILDLKERFFNVYPNPTSDYIFINFSRECGQNIELKIYDLYGKIILQKEMKQFNQELNIITLPKGMYIIKVNNGKINSEVKLMKL